METMPFTSEVVDGIVAQLQRDLPDLHPFKTTTQLFIKSGGEMKASHVVDADVGDHLQLCVVRQHDGREYAHCVMMRDPKTDYAPVFRGWWANITERLAQQDNRSAA